MCDQEGCDKPARSKGLCAAHYQQHRRRERDPETGTRKPGPRPDPTAERSRHNAANPTRKRTGRPERRFATETHCANGHEFVTTGMYRAPSGRPVCKQCRRDSQRKYKGLSPTVGPVGPHNRDKTECPQGHPYSKVGFTRTEGTRGCRICRRQGWVRRIYGLTPEQWDTLVLGQEGRCAVCSAAHGNVHVDHDHVTGAPRGLLCGECNMGLGKFRDDPALLRAAADYLDSFVGASST
jgi:hypothetical protein